MVNHIDMAYELVSQAYLCFYRRFNEERSELDLYLIAVNSEFCLRRDLLIIAYNIKILYVLLAFIKMVMTFNIWLLNVINP